MLIDSCTFVGHWPFRRLPGETLAQNTAIAARSRITHMCCTNLNAIFYLDPMEGNRELWDALQEYRGSVQVLPFAVCNPAYVEWERDLRVCTGMGFRGVQLTPQYHGYAPDGEAARRAYQLAGELGLAVKLDVGFENIRQRSPLDTFRELTGDELARLIGASDAPVTLVSTGNPAGMGDAFRDAVCRRENVFCNLIYPDSFTARTLEACVERFGASRLCFGSQLPFRYVEPQYVKLFLSDALDDEAKSAVLYGNLQRAFSLR